MCIRNNLERFELKTSLPVLFDCRGRGEKLLGVPLSRSGISVFTPAAGSFKTEVRKEAAEISEGTYKIQRRLPYEGEIFVKPGQEVKPDDIIGENRFGPPKLYIIDIHRFIGYNKKLDEKTFLAGVQVKVGDHVKLGQRIFKAKGAGPLGISFYCQSPVRGEVTQIEKKKIDTKKGTVTIQYHITPIPLRSFVSGKVSRVKENLGVEITGQGTTLYGIIGFGGEASGKIALLRNTNDLNYSHKERIVVAFKPIDEGFLRKAAEAGVAGLIAPSIHNADWVCFYGEEIGVALTGDEQIPFTLILTEGFGRFAMNERYRSFFEKAAGKLASISGRTQIRAGVTRPTVIVSE